VVNGNEEKTRGDESEFQEKVGEKASRKIQARADKKKNIWFWLGMYGLVGWSVAIPTLIGIAIGVWIDKRWKSPISWTLTLLFVGVVIGCLNAWYWVKKESKRD